MLTLKQDTMLGDVRGDWEVKPLKALLKWNAPGDWGDDRGPHIARVLRSTNLTNEGRLDLSDIASRALTPEKVELLSPRKGDILLERSGGGPQQPVGRVGFIKEDMPGHAFSNFLHLLRPNPDAIDPRFLNWVLFRINGTGRVLRLEQQTTQLRNLNFREYLTMLLPVPPMAEQANIARILDAADRAIEHARNTLSNAEIVRQSLLSDLLSRGIDENGRIRNRAVSRLFATTPLGTLPIDWHLSTIGHEFDLQNGFTLNEARRAKIKRRRYLRVANVHRDSLRLDDISELEAGDAEFAPRVLERDDLLVVEGHADRMQIGRCARVTEAASGMTFQNHLFRLRSKGKLLPAFACAWLNSSYAQRYWNARCATSSGLNTINQRMLKRLVLAVPRMAEQETISAIIERQRCHLELMQDKLMRLNELKKSLMHDLLTGAVRVTDCDLTSLS
jgi:type I restriction enzyme S subunit